MKKSFLDIYYLIVFELFSLIVLLCIDVRMQVFPLIITGAVAGYLLALLFYNLHDINAYIIKNRTRIFRGASRKKRSKMPGYHFRMIPDMHRKAVRRSGFSNPNLRHHHHHHEAGTEK